MNTVTKHDREPQVLMLALASITPSAYQPRQTFNEAAMQELIESVSSKGILVSVLCRPHPSGKKDHYELVYGERRYRAAKAAKLGVIPAQVRDLSDSEVLEVQLIENRQRHDVHPQEEAEGFQRLLASKHADGTPYTVADLAQKIGVTQSHVYQRLKLCSLCPEARKAFLAEKFDGRTANLIARIGHHDTQRKALKDILGGHGDGEPLSYKRAHQYVLHNYMLKLSAAPFDTKDPLLVEKAGDCIKCPKRTGNTPDLFGDVKSADVCSDPKCFDDKRQAHFAKAAIDLEAQGRKVLYGEAAKAVFPQWEDSNDFLRDRLSQKFMPMDGHVWTGNRQSAVRDIMGVEYKATVVQHPQTGTMFEVATQQAVQAAVERARKAGSKGKAAKNSVKMVAPKGPDVDQMLTARLAVMLHEKAPKTFNRTWFVELASHVRRHLSTRDLDAVALAWGWKPSAFSGGNGYSYSEKLPAEAQKLSERDLVMLMFDMIFAIGSFSRGPVLKLFGINEKQVREKVIEDRKAAAKKAREEAKAAKAAKPKGKAPGKEKAKSK